VKSAMKIDIRADELENFCRLHFDDNKQSFENVRSAIVEFDWIESMFDPKKHKERKKIIEICKTIKNVTVEFEANENAELSSYDPPPPKTSSNMQLVLNILKYLGAKKKKTLIIAGSGCDAPAVWTFGNVEARIKRGATPESIVETWAKKIIESRRTDTVKKLAKIVNKYNNFQVVTTNVTRSFELAGISINKIHRAVDNKMEWLDKGSGKVKIKIGYNRPREVDVFNSEMKNQDALLFLGYGFNTFNESSYLHRYPMANLLIFDKIDVFQKKELKNRIDEKRGSGYLKIIDDLNSLFFNIPF
jgi:hypothetical protein